VEGGAALNTGAMALLRGQKLVDSNLTSADVFQPVPNAWTENRVVFAAGSGDSVNLWQLSLSAKDFRAAGIPQRLTSGAGVEADPSLWAGPDKTRLVFSSLAANTDIWSLPLDPDQAKVLGSPQRLTEDLAADIRPSVSADGKKLVFNSNRSGNWDVWYKDLTTGRETALTSTPVNEENPRISPDGANVVYRAREQDRIATYLIPITGGVAQKVTEECGQIFAWAFDNRRFICAGQDLSLVDVFTRERKPIVEHRVGGAAARLSWDDRWITFYRNTGPGRAQIYVAPVREGAPAADRELIAVTDGKNLDRLPEFSPRGGLIYFMSMRDGSDCLWAVRPEAGTKKPAGDPFPVQHFHSARRSPTYVRAGQRAISMARDKIAFTMEERTGNIWMAELDRQNRRTVQRIPAVSGTGFPTKLLEKQNVSVPAKVLARPGNKRSGRIRNSFGLRRIFSHSIRARSSGCSFQNLTVLGLCWCSLFQVVFSTVQMAGRRHTFGTPLRGRLTLSGPVPHFQFSKESPTKVARKSIPLLSQSVGAVPTPTTGTESVETICEFFFSQCFKPKCETEFKHGCVVEVGFELWQPLLGSIPTFPSPAAK